MTEYPLNRWLSIAELECQSLSDVLQGYCGLLLLRGEHPNQENEQHWEKTEDQKSEPKPPVGFCICLNQQLCLICFRPAEEAGQALRGTRRLLFRLRQVPQEFHRGAQP